MSGYGTFDFIYFFYIPRISFRLVSLVGNIQAPF